MTNDETFGKRLCRLMRDRAYTVRWTATKAGVSDSTLQDWRTGAQPRDWGAVKRLSQLLGVTLDYLMFGDPTEFIEEGKHDSIF